MRLGLISIVQSLSVKRFARVTVVGVVSLGLTSMIVAAPKKGGGEGGPGGGAAGGSIKSIMTKGFKGDSSLIKKVSAGDGTPDDVKNLLQMCNALAAAKPKKGDLAAWKQKTTALVDATTAIQKGDKSGVDALKTAADCKACHSEHKGGK